ncbi:MAG: hypothetical protein ACOC80_16000 [Petrotogales bacterium]
MSEEVSKRKFIFKCQNCGKTVGNFYASELFQFANFGGDVGTSSGIIINTNGTNGMSTFTGRTDSQDIPNPKTKETVYKDGILCKTCHQLEKLKE